MFLVKILERKEVIRFFGTSLILAPFVNHFAKISLLVNVPNRWTFRIIWQVFQNNHVSTQLLAVASLIIGILMLNGSAKAWRYALFLLGCYIVVQLTQFGSALKASKVALLFLLTNIGLFLFIADQLVWKVQGQPKSNGKKPQPLSLSTQRKVKIEWKNYGIWGELSKIDPEGIAVRSKISKLPFELQDRGIQLELKNGTLIQTHFSHQKGNIYFFKFEEMSPEKVRGLNLWLKAL